MKHLEGFVQHQKLIEQWKQYEAQQEARRRASLPDAPLDEELRLAVIAALEELQQQLMLQALADPEFNEQLQRAGFRIYLKDGQPAIRFVPQRGL